MTDPTVRPFLVHPRATIPPQDPPTKTPQREITGATEGPTNLPQRVPQHPHRGKLLEPQRGHKFPTRTPVWKIAGPTNSPQKRQCGKLLDPQTPHKSRTEGSTKTPLWRPTTEGYVGTHCGVSCGVSCGREVRGRGVGRVAEY